MGHGRRRSLSSWSTIHRVNFSRDNRAPPFRASPLIHRWLNSASPPSSLFLASPLEYTHDLADTWSRYRWHESCPGPIFTQLSGSYEEQVEEGREPFGRNRDICASVVLTAHCICSLCTEYVVMACIYPGSTATGGRFPHSCPHQGSSGCSTQPTAGTWPSFFLLTACTPYLPAGRLATT
jgi:hypothetical protein